MLDTWESRIWKQERWISMRWGWPHYFALLLLGKTSFGLQMFWNYDLSQEKVVKVVKCFESLLQEKTSKKLKVCRNSGTHIISPLWLFWRLAVIDWPLLRSDAHAAALLPQDGEQEPLGEGSRHLYSSPACLMSQNWWLFTMSTMGLRKMKAHQFSQSVGGIWFWCWKLFYIVVGTVTSR